ncbi:MAG: carbohydrate kinase [Rhizobiales bacterium NRL2]|jgi:ribokinase|nr:MAG: carbohydrate kinase [Rhizobiales bacterium NRL2]
MKILTVGGAMVDAIAIVDSDHIERITMRNADTSYLLMEEGRKTEALDISTHCGGGAVNAAVAMARLGHDVSALVKLGQDPRADQVLTGLEAEGVSTRWAMRVAGQKTGASLIIASHERNAGIFAFRGANTTIRPDDLKPEAFGVDLCYVTSLSNESADCFPEIVARAKAKGALVAVNPGIRQLSARQGPFRECLDRIDLLAVNRVEADALVAGLAGKFGEGGAKIEHDPDQPLPDLLTRGFEGGGFHMTARAYFKALADCGPRWVLVTDGRDGAFLATEGRLHHCPPAPAEVVGTAGAGDAYCATLASGLAAGLAPAEAMVRATLNAAAVVGHVDTQAGLMDAAALDAARAAARIEVESWAI